MSSKVIWVRSYAERLPDGQWNAFCVTFNLGAQADTAEEVRRKLDAMIADYLCDVAASKDVAYAEQFLRRRAPLYFWLRYWSVWLRLRLHAFSRRNQPFVETFTYPVPQAC